MEYIDDKNDTIISQIINGKFQNIVVVTGAGVSTGSGIADYRSKNGIFVDLLKEFPQAKSAVDLFSKDFIDKYQVFENPIYKQHIELIKNANPSTAHMLCKWFYDKGWLRRVYTQNIDGLHQKAGVPEDFVVEYHGSLIKENIVWYGDEISQKVVLKTVDDFVTEGNNKIPIDLILVMGTSLQVKPFCAIPNMVRKECTRVLIDINPENAFTNTWSKQTKFISSLSDDTMSPSSRVRIGKRFVLLRPQWNTNSKWKTQYIINMDVDLWSSQIINNTTL